MTELIEKGYEKSFGHVMGFAACSGVSLFFAVGYWLVISAKAGEPVNLIGAVAAVYEFGGPTALLVVSFLFAIVAIVLIIVRVKSKGELLRSFGADAIDQIELEKARAYAKKQGIIGRPPAHHESLETFRAYKRRLRVMFIIMFVVFSFVAVAAVLGLV